MPRMMPLNINYPNYGEAALTGREIQGADIKNALLRPAAENAPQAVATEQAQRDVNLKSSKSAYELEKLQTIASLMRGVQDDAGYKRAVEQYIKAFPDEIGALKQLPNQYDPKVVEQIVTSAQTAAERIAGTNLAGKMVDAGKQTWGQPKAGVNDKGEQVWFQTDNNGETRILSGVKPEPKKGMKIYDPTTGQLMVDMGGDSAPDMQKKTAADIESKIVGGKEQLARMQAIYSEYKPEYQELGTRFKAAWTGTKAFLGMDVPQEDRIKLTEFKSYQRKAIENINLYIKELTGAQMSEKEADRLRLAQPDPGEKWYSGDDPITFKSKMDDVLKMTRAAVARWEYYRNQGISDTQIKSKINSGSALSLEDMAARMK